MSIQKTDLKSFSGAVLSSYNLESIKICREKALKAIEKELSDTFMELNLASTKKARLEHFKMGKEADYSERLLTLGSQKDIICGIRHMGCDPNLPFINVIPNFQIKTYEDLKNIAKNALPCFEMFRPKFICLWDSQKKEADLIGQAYLVAEMMSIKKHEAIRPRDDLRLEKIINNSYYNWYKKEYAKFHAQYPELRWQVELNSPQIMNESLEEGLLFFAKLKEKKVGLIAAKKEAFLGHNGLYFNEILVADEWKGKGLAKELQKLFLLNYCQDNEVVWGTIDIRNRPSFKTALANGRKPIRYENFFELKNLV